MGERHRKKNTKRLAIQRARRLHHREKEEQRRIQRNEKDKKCEGINDWDPEIRIYNSRNNQRVANFWKRATPFQRASIEHGFTDVHEQVFGDEDWGLNFEEVDEDGFSFNFYWNYKCLFLRMIT